MKVETLMGCAVVKQQIALRMDIIHRKQDKLEEGQPLFEAALKIREKRLGYYSRELEGELDNIAIMYQAQGRLHKAKPFADRAWRIRFDIRAEAMLNVLKKEMGEGTQKAGEGVKVLFNHLEREVHAKERASSKIRRCNRDLEKTHKAIKACKDEYAEKSAEIDDRLKKAVEYVEDAHDGTREQNRRKSLLKAVEAEEKAMRELYADTGIDFYAERIKKEIAVEAIIEEHALHAGLEKEYRVKLKEAQDSFVEEHTGIIRQAFRIFDEDSSGSLDYEETRRVLDGLGQLP